ncbi:MFS transporter [Streptomyces sp. RKAG293]|uniref:MFS transporter n=1 Tax=Streptomyces sp. RKAG293 TaxID=2893403 RepID=UPI00203355AA|nr:MFS transporter [Streptomyces sp. RKAG293]MCM2416652.1 MFS transporter [Streptomyces sp. RKAG293]
MTGDVAVPERSGVAGGLRAYPSFLRLWAGQASGAIGDQVLPVAMSLYVLHHGGGAGAVGEVLAGRAAALVVCLLAGGVIADRMRRTRVLIGADCFRAVVLVAAGLVLPRLALGVLPLVTALVGAGEALSRPASRSLLPALLPDALLERGNALVAAAQRGSAVLGALVGVGAVTLIGVRPALFVTAGVFAVGALMVRGVPDAGPRAAAQRAGVVRDALAGLRAVRRRGWVMAVMGTVCLHLFAGSATALTMLPVVARRDFGGDLAYGLVLAAMGAGALPAIALAGRWRPRARGAVSLLALSGYALVPLSLAGPLPLPGVIGCFAWGGFVVELSFVYWISALQRAFPNEVLGKVFALDQLGAYALLPVGYVLVGPVVAVVGAAGTLIGGAVVVAVSSVVCLAVPGVARFADPAPLGPADADGAPCGPADADPASLRAADVDGAPCGPIGADPAPLGPAGADGAPAGPGSAGPARLVPADPHDAGPASTGPPRSAG